MTAARHITLILGALAACVLVLSFTADAGTLEQGWLAWWPECSARRAGGSCSLCGMSHAFVAMSRGRVAEAREYHPLGPLVYAGFAAFALAALALAAGTFRRSRCLQQHTG